MPRARSGRQSSHVYSQPLLVTALPSCLLVVLRAVLVVVTSDMPECLRQDHFGFSITGNKRHREESQILLPLRRDWKRRLRGGWSKVSWFTGVKSISNLGIFLLQGGRQKAQVLNTSLMHSESELDSDEAIFTWPDREKGKLLRSQNGSVRNGQLALKAKNQREEIL